MVGGAVLFFPDSDFSSSLAYAVGSALYTIDSIAAIWLWRDEQFGLTFLAALNEFKPRNRNNSPQSGAAATTPQFSGRGFLFINIYCLISVISTFNFCMQAFHFAQETDLFSFTRMVNEVLPLMIVSAVLVVHSAVVETPKAQPWHMLIMAARILALAIGANAVVSFYLLIVEQEHPPPPPPHLLHHEHDPRLALGSNILHL